MKTQEEFIQDMESKHVPKEVISYFIENDRNLNFSSTDELDVQQIEFYNYDEIETTEIYISTWEYRENSHIEIEPNINEDGCYKFSAINFIKEVNDYLSDGLLIWIPDLKQFGTSDTDHGRVYIFKDVEWKQILENIFIYVNTQWNYYESNLKTLEGKYKIFDVYKHYKPWELWDFIKD